jgi:hypothetical protein|tara:strand:- start:2397 stop:2831 length:435 start_codon:yes stop_codon:yes gene_type:complete
MSKSNLNEEYLIKSLDNENNVGIENLSTRKIKSLKNDYLQQLQLSRDDLKNYHSKLKEYRFVDDLTNIQYGRYIRWISLKNPEKLCLTTGGVIIDIQLLEDGIYILCKNFRNKRMKIKIDECFIFQKLTDQEKTIIAALDYLEK